MTKYEKRPRQPFWTRTSNTLTFQSTSLFFLKDTTELKGQLVTRTVPMYFSNTPQAVLYGTQSTSKISVKSNIMCVYILLLKLYYKANY